MKAKKLVWKSDGKRHSVELEGRCNTFNIKCNYDGTFKVELPFRKVDCETLEEAMETAQIVADFLVNLFSKPLEWEDRVNDPKLIKKSLGGKPLFRVKHGRRILFPIKQASGDSWEINLGFGKKHIYNDEDVCKSAAQADANWLFKVLAESPE